MDHTTVQQLFTDFSFLKTNGDIDFVVANTNDGVLQWANVLRSRVTLMADTVACALVNNDVLSLVFQDLSTEDVLRASLVCRQFNTVAKKVCGDKVKEESIQVAVHTLKEMTSPALTYGSYHAAFVQFRPIFKRRSRYIKSTGATDLFLDNITSTWLFSVEGTSWFSSCQGHGGSIPNWFVENEKIFMMEQVNLVIRTIISDLQESFKIYTQNHEKEHYLKGEFIKTVNDWEQAKLSSQQL